MGGPAGVRALDRRAVGGCHLAAVVERLVRAPIEEDRSVAGEDRDHRQVDQGDRREDQRVLAAEELRQALLDLLVEDRAAEETRPARVGSPPLEVRRNDVDDLAIEVRLIEQGEVLYIGDEGAPPREASRDWSDGDGILYIE